MLARLLIGLFVFVSVGVDVGRLPLQQWILLKERIAPCSIAWSQFELPFDLVILLAFTFNLVEYCSSEFSI